MNPVHLPPTMGKPTKMFQVQVTKELITCAEGSPDYRLAWQYTGLPKFLLFAQRWQILSVVERDGKTLTEYYTFEVFSGILSYVGEFLPLP